MGETTYATEQATIQSNKAPHLYSGYHCTLSGTVFDSSISEGQSGTVSVKSGSSDVTLASSSVESSAGKATVSAMFYLAEGTATDANDLTRQVTVTVGGKTFDAVEVTFSKSGPHKKAGDTSFAGVYPGGITASTATIQDATDGIVTGNYQITYVPGTLTVSKGASAITTVPTARSWPGSPSGPTRPPQPSRTSSPRGPTTCA